MLKHRPCRNIDHAKTLICNDVISSLSPTKSNPRWVFKKSSVSANNIPYKVNLNGSPGTPVVNEISQRVGGKWREPHITSARPRASLNRGWPWASTGQGWISDYYEYGDTYNNLVNGPMAHAYKAINHIHLISLVQILTKI